MLRRLTPVIALAALVASGCTGAPDPASATKTATATATTAPTTISASARPTVAPPVSDPVDLRRFHDHPCAALTPAQQKQLGFQKFDPVDHEGAGPTTGSCVWTEKPKTGTDDGYGYRLTLTMSGDPLAEAYADSGHQEGYRWEVFEMREVRGLPAVLRSLSTPDDQCSIVVSTGRGQGIEVDGTITADDPTLSDRFAKAAGWIIDAARR